MTRDCILHDDEDMIEFEEADSVQFGFSSLRQVLDLLCEAQSKESVEHSRTTKMDCRSEAKAFDSSGFST